MAGRPPKKFDLAELEKLCILQCTIEEVAAFFEVSHDTVQRRMAKEKQFREVMERGYQKGKISVRRKQMQLLEAGNATMAVWLGKQLLGQRDGIDFSGPGGGPIQHEHSATTELLSRLAGLASRVRATEDPE